jgi:predicted DNA-binding protein
VRLSNPTHIRLTTDLQQRLDGWRGDRMNRATAIRLLLEQALRLHCDGVLPVTAQIQKT